ncbi:uncharacterized protein LOC112589129 [Harpegnathos saltator]|uniref:uncharacterized protein LOC112589129 n=1 Tax=Harpegnathos saltator TaxID=610380 RepID=UPI000DBED461|nr:uncharacterized protein LOC112589129 [Harpegnathos saltator]
MTKLRAEIDLLALGISGLRPKRAVTGALILEVPGEGGAERAQKLVPLMEAALAGSGVRVARPVRRAELRVTGLVEATTKEEIGKVGDPGGNVRGPILMSWAEGLGLRLLNDGSGPTCVRSQGTSYVDVVRIPCGRRHGDRMGVLDEETLSDHRYIRLVVSSPGGGIRRRARPEGSSPRWALRRLDRDALGAAVVAVAWSQNIEGPCRDVEEEAKWLRGVMADISDAGMPRTGRAPPRRSVYWWSPEIDSLRARCNTVRSRYADARRKQSGGSDTAATAALGEAYREARRGLTKAIEGAKAKAWAELLATLDADPWGRPYKMVRNKLRTWTPPVTEMLDPQFLGGVINTLFPVVPGEGTRPPESSDLTDWSDELGVTEEELAVLWIGRG